MTVPYGKKKIVALFVVWCISALLFTLFNKLSNGFWELYVSPYHEIIPVAITILVTILYFIPLLRVIYNRAKAISFTPLMIIAKTLLILLGFVSVLFAIALVVATFKGSSALALA